MIFVKIKKENSLKIQNLSRWGPVDFFSLFTQENMQYTVTELQRNKWLKGHWTTSASSPIFFFQKKLRSVYFCSDCIHAQSYNFKPVWETCIIRLGAIW